MHYTEKTVAVSHSAETTSEGAANYHRQNFHSAIEDFFFNGLPSSFQEVNNELLNVYLDQSLKNPEETSKHQVKNVVDLCMLQSTFISRLYEQWNHYKQFSNP
jgi:hypothetical protein